MRLSSTRPTEAHAIKMRLAGIVPPRPLTHDLLQSLIGALGAGLRKIVIDKLVDGTFYAKLILLSADDDKKETVVDARPSDCIALAVRCKSPIFVADEVLQKADMFHQET